MLEFIKKFFQEASENLTANITALLTHRRTVIGSEYSGSTDTRSEPLQVSHVTEMRNIDNLARWRARYSIYEAEQRRTNAMARFNGFAPSFNVVLNNDEELFSDYK